MKTKLFLAMMLIMMVFGGVPNLIAQEDEGRVIILHAPWDGAIAFQAIGVEGEPIELGMLPDIFVIANFQEASSERSSIIRDPSDFALSPDQQYIAFSAQNGSETRLFVYQITGEEVWSSPVESRIQVRWSPSSRGFLFAPIEVMSVSNHTGLAYFQLETEQVIKINVPFENWLIRQIRWLDHEQFVFDAITNIDGAILHVLTLDGEITPLFSAHDVLSSNLIDSLCEREWSESEQLLYFGVGCTSSPETVILEALYSVDLEGNANLILAPPAEFFGDHFYQAYFRVSGIETYEDRTYVVIQENFYIPDTESSEAIMDFAWRVLQINANEIAEVYASTTDQFALIESPQISPNGRYLTVGTHSGGDNSALLVIDLEAGSVIRKIDTLGSYGWTVAWLNHYQFLYTNSYSSEACGCAYPRLGNRVLFVDLSKLPIVELTDTFTDSSWLFGED